MNKQAAHTITIPAAVTRIAIEAWPADAPTRGIIWDRTARQDDDGEWGEQLIDWTGTLADAVIALERDGFTVGDMIQQDVGDGAELFGQAAR